MDRGAGGQSDHWCSGDLQRHGEDEERHWRHVGAARNPPQTLHAGLDRKTVEAALREGGYPRFLTALRNAPEVGQLVLGGSEPFAIRYAREKVEGGGRSIIVVTDRPVFFISGGRPGGTKSRAGYEIGVVEIQLDVTGQGRGVMAAAARVRPDGDGGVLLDDYAQELITLTELTRKSP